MNNANHNADSQDINKPCSNVDTKHSLEKRTNAINIPSKRESMPLGEMDMIVMIKFDNHLSSIPWHITLWMCFENIYISKELFFLLFQISTIFSKHTKRCIIPPMKLTNRTRLHSNSSSKFILSILCTLVQQNRSSSKFKLKVYIIHLVYFVMSFLNWWAN